MDLKLLKQIRAIVNDRKTLLPILSCFYIDKDWLWISNLEITVRIRHHFAFAKDTGGPVLIDSGYFISRLEHIRAPWDMLPETTTNKVLFRSPSGETLIPGEDPKEFESPSIMPKLPDEKSREMFTLSAYDINIMDIARQFTADDTLRPVMMQVVIDQDRIVASDAHMLYFKMITKKHEEQVLFSNQVIRLMKLASGQDFRLMVVGKNNCVQSQDMTIWWQMYDPVKDPAFEWYRTAKTYPNWRTVVPQDIKGKIVVPVKELMEALKSIKFAMNPAANQVTMKVKGNKLYLSARDLDVSLRAEETVDIWKILGDDITFGMKYDFLMKVLKVFRDEGYPQVEVGFTDASRAFVMADQVLIMPMMIQEEYERY